MSYALIIDVYSIILTLLTPSEFISPINIDLASSFFASVILQFFFTYFTTFMLSS